MTTAVGGGGRGGGGRGREDHLIEMGSMREMSGVT